MIKVIASDFDGTLLGNDHKIAPETLTAVKKAQEAGIRFIAATGRNYNAIQMALQGVSLTCDYILASGAEIRDPSGAVLSRIGIDLDLCEELYNKIKKYSISATLMTDDYDYIIGTPEEIEEATMISLKLFFTDMSKEEVLASDLFQDMLANKKVVPTFREFARAGVPVYKLFLASERKEVLDKISGELSVYPQIAIASSFPLNLEITNIRAQKGPVLKTYIESLGYCMDEVMVLGDSLNDASMLSMDFGATIAMGNADDEVKAMAKYVTKSNEDLGVAYTIQELLKRQY